MKALFTSALLLCSILLQAQNVENFGKVSKDELQMKECSFDKEADAVVLLHEAFSNYNDRYNLVTEHHVRLKILKEKGMSYANVTVPYYAEDEFEFIGDIDGIVINQNPDGSIQKHELDKKSIFRQRVTNFLGEVKMAFPSVRVGSIIEYRYTSTMKHYGGLEDWHFQREIPVVRSKYRLSIVPNAEFSYVVNKHPKYNVDIKQDTRDALVNFEMKDIPALTNEPYMDARRDYLQRVDFQLSGYSRGNSVRKFMTSWDEVMKELIIDDRFGRQLNKSLSGTDDFVKLAKQNSVAFEKMKLVFNYVKTNMKWNGYGGKYSSDGIKSAWNKKTGSTGDINLILVNLLQSVDLKADPILISERRAGSVNPAIPFVDQFNKVMAVVTIDNRKYYLDATDHFTPPHIIPSPILNTHALVVNRKSGGIQQISDDLLQYKDVVYITANIKEGKLLGKAAVTSSDYARVQRLEDYTEDNKEYLDGYFKSTVPNVTIDSFELTNETNDSLPLRNEFQFNIPLSENGDYLFIPLNFFTGYATNPFIADKRFSNINFGYKKLMSASVFIDIPKGYNIDVLPKSIMVTNVDKTIVCSREIFQDQNSGKLLARVRIECKKSYYSVEEYPDIKEFYKKMFDLLNEQVVLKK